MTQALGALSCLLLTGGGSARAVAPEASIGPTLTASAWCVIAASPPYRAWASAVKLAATVRGAGLPDAAVYDTRDFLDMAPGRLAVVAAALQDKAAAAEAVQKLAAAKLKAFAKRCSPVAGGAKPLAEAPIVGAGVSPMAVPEAIVAGCFAWSPKRLSAACLVGSAGWQDGIAWRVVFTGGDAPEVEWVPRAPFGAPDDSAERPAIPVTADARRALARVLADGAYVPFAQATDPAEWPTFSVTTDEKNLDAGGENDPPDVRLEVAARCRSGRKQILLSEEEDGGSDLEARVTRIRGGRHVVVAISWSYGREGDYGAHHRVAQVDLLSLCGAKR